MGHSGPFACLNWMNLEQLAGVRARFYCFIQCSSRTGRQENQMAKLKTTVNKVRCISSEDCVESAPGVFRLDDDGKSEVYNPGGAPDAAIMAAARACPAKAIIVVDEETGTQLFPPPKK